jgi:hypothetical protein
VIYQQITSSSDEAINVALGLVDEADKAAQKMVAACETLLAAVREGTEQIGRIRHRDARLQRGDRSEEQGVCRGGAQHYRHDQLAYWSRAGANEGSRAWGWRRDASLNFPDVTDSEK